MALPKPELFVAPGLRLEWQRLGGTSWQVIAWRPHVSQLFTDRRALLQFVRWPASTPTGQLIRGWLDAQISALSPAPASQGSGEPAELDPTHHTRMVT